MKVIHIDFETRSTMDLRKVGVHRYASHQSTDIWCAAFAVDDENILVWKPGDHCPDQIKTAINEGVLFIAHNAQFERILWKEVLTKKYGWPEPKPEQWRCTMVMALAMSLPGSLEGAAAAVGLDIQKDMQGRRLMLQMCRPRKINKDGSIIWWDEAEKQQRLIDYCKTDVAVERALEKRLRPLRSTEQELWFLDQRINDRGVHIDIESVQSAQIIVQTASKKLNKQMKEVTNGEVGTCNQNAKLIQWLNSHGIETDSVAKAVIPELLKQDLLVAVRKALLLRQEAAKSSTAKLKKMLEVVGEQNRARGLFQFHGASTGRWAGRLIQLQNFPRPALKQAEIESALAIIKEENNELLELLYGPALGTVSSCLRGMITAAPGYDLIAADYSAIEARAVAWLAGEEKVLDVFRGHGKIYEHAAAGIYNVPVEEVTKEQRFIVKLSILSLGYSGGVKAFKSMANAYGVEIKEEKAEAIKTAWREDNPYIVQFWKDLERAAINAVSYPGTAFSVRDKIIFKTNGSFLWCRLPSGRLLCYPYPSIEQKETPWGAIKPMLAFKGVDSLSKKWGPQSTYGGRLAENCLASDTKILTHQGVKKIVDIHSNDLVWDGYSWVSTKGVIYKGKREVITWLDIRITPDHMIFDGISWKPVIALDDDATHECLKWALNSINSLLWSQEEETTAKQYASAHVGKNIKHQTGLYSEEEQGTVENVDIKKQEKNNQKSEDYQQSFPIQNCCQCGDIDTQELSHVATTQIVKPTLTMEDEELNYGPNGIEIKSSFLNTQKHCLDGMTPLLTESTTMGTTLRATYGLSPEHVTQETAEQPECLNSWANRSLTWISGRNTVLDGKVTTLSMPISNREKHRKKLRSTTCSVEKVYDLLDCGPNHRFTVITEHGPVVVHNCTQALSVDLLSAALIRLEKNGYPVVIHVHDEIVCEVPEGIADLKKFEALMAEVPSWASTLPVSAEGWIGKRYRK
ncbi:DNA polymerase [Magnetococcales bacterium HHB-1]